MGFVREKGLHDNCKSFTCRKTLSALFPQLFCLKYLPINALYLSRHVYLTQGSNSCLRGLRNIFLAFMGMSYFPFVCVIFICTSVSSVVFFNPKFRNDCSMCCMPFYL